MIIIDTHVLLWHLLSPSKLSSKASKAIESGNKSNGILISEISLWEIAMLIKKRRVEIGISLVEFINLAKTTNRLLFEGISAEIAELSANLDLSINADPADRIICATAIVNKASLITKDRNLLKSKIVKTIW